MNPFGNRKRLYQITLALAALSLGGGLYAAFHVSDLPLIGTVDANQVLVGPQVAGRVQRLCVSEGQEVKEGDLIAILDGRELAAANDSSWSQARSLERQVRAAKASAQGTQGEVSSGLGAAQAALEMTEATQLEALANLKRQEALTQRTLSLAKQGVVSRQDQETSQRDLEALQARERSAAKAVEQARAELRLAQAKLHQDQAAHETAASVEGQFLAAQAQAEEAETRLGYTRITAPVSGRVATLVAREGEVVTAGAPLVALLDLSQTWVYVALPETEAGCVKVGDALPVRMPGGARLQGQVIAKGMEAEFATQRDVSGEKRDIRTVRLKLLVANPEGRYVPGMTAEALLPASLRRTR